MFNPKFLLSRNILTRNLELFKVIYLANKTELRARPLLQSSSHPWHRPKSQKVRRENRSPQFSVITNTIFQNVLYGEKNFCKTLNSVFLGLIIFRLITVEIIRISKLKRVFDNSLFKIIILKLYNKLKILHLINGK